MISTASPGRLLVAAALAALPPALPAEPLAVDDDIQAQAFSFTHGGACYAILPDHVTPRSRLDVVTATPPRRGIVEIINFMRFEQLDLALGTVVGAAAEPCEPVIGDLRRDDGRTLAAATAATLTTLRRSGVVENEPVILKVVEYEYIGVDPADPRMRGRLGQGRSGAVLTIDGRPVGMMIDVAGEGIGYGAEIRALRFDAALSWLARYLERPTLQAAAAGQADRREAGEVAYTVSAWSAASMRPDGDPRSIARPAAGPYLIAPGDVPATIVLEPRDADAFTLGGIAFEGAAVEGVTTVPRNVSIQVARRPGGAFRTLRTAALPLAGRAEVPVGGQRFAALRIVIEDAWDPVLPVRLDRVRLLAHE